MLRLKRRFPTRRRPWLAALVVVTFFGVLASLYLILSPYRELDVLIVNGTVVDGSGAPPQVCDIGIRDHKIVGLSRWRFLLARAKLVIDARNLIVSPGFIDVHTHVERNIPKSETFRADNFSDKA